MHRIKFLDGLRGLAILLVLLFHVFSRYPDLVPFSAKYNNFFREGWLGVELFFMISGFVIFMSLENSIGLRLFMYKRWLRLFPSMLICSLLIFLTSGLLHERPAGIPNKLDLLPGLLFLEPQWLSNLIGINIRPIEFSFWSLFVEFKFYVIFGSFYFLSKRNGLLSIFCLIFLYVIYIIAGQLGILRVKVVLGELSVQYYLWFATGALSYVYYTNKNRYNLLTAFLAGMVSITTLAAGKESFIAAFFLVNLFFLLLIFPKCRIIVNNRLFLFLGLISYPFYLLHENGVIALIIKLSKFGLQDPMLLLFLATTPIIFIAYIVAKYLEPILVAILKKNISFLMKILAIPFKIQKR